MSDPSEPRKYPSFLDLPPRDGEREPADEDQPTTVQPAVDQPTELQPAVEQPTEAQAIVDQPTVEGAALSEALAHATAPVSPADTGGTPVSVGSGTTAPTEPGASSPAGPGDAPAPSTGDAAPEQPTESTERRPGFRERGRMRRRLRYLRRVRELLVRDLGGLVFDLRRFERKRDDLVAQKVDQIRACDDELRALELALDERRDVRDVRLPGIGGNCPRCFSLYGSTDRFCSHCGAALGGAAQGPAQVAPVTAPAAGTQPAGTSQPAAGTPSAASESPGVAQPPSAGTSQPAAGPPPAATQPATAGEWPGAAAPNAPASPSTPPWMAGPSPDAAQLPEEPGGDSASSPPRDPSQ